MESNEMEFQVFFWLQVGLVFYVTLSKSKKTRQRHNLMANVHLIV